MDIPKVYSSKEVEDKWYAYWMKEDFFHSEPDNREPYTIVIPPPNVTGILHMGHMLNNTVQDVLVRRARLMGKNACWVPGTDHASIATEAKVVKKLKEEGIDKKNISRDEFLKHAWDWTHKHGGIILEQLKKLGASCDWERTKFTMDKELSESVQDVFIRLYEKGWIYRGHRMVNWDVQALTAVSDEEVIHKEEQSTLYHLQYAIEGENGHITIATTRPETILGDTAICVHPDDDRYKNLVGKKALVPLIERAIPIIADDYVDPEFGSGALKVTPAHDVNDYEISRRHDLESIEILDEHGNLNENAQILVGKDRFKARKEIQVLLQEKGYLLKEESIQNKIGYSERTNVVIEPRLSLQWYLKMDEISKPALHSVLNEKVHFYPKHVINTYKHWMENIRDWCISRQLWWGHRIPVWYYGSKIDEFVVAENEDEALEKAKKKNISVTKDSLKQDQDVLDTWFSSWLWPLAVFDGVRNPDNPEINYYYPTNDLVTAPEILFFWVARMIMAGYEYRGEKPFENVYFTGIVRDSQRRKMSKQLGNSPDPLELMKKYGADGVRVGLLLASPAGNDLLFDEKLCEQGSRFSNKIWNALRLLKSWEIDENIEQTSLQKSASEWMRSTFHAKFKDIEHNFSQFRLSDALMGVYKLIWDDFCSWYLEMIKPEYQKPIDAKTYQQALDIWNDVLTIAHPFIPFITEEIWHILPFDHSQKSVMFNSWPTEAKRNNALEEATGNFMNVIMEIRKFRNSQNGLSPNTTLTVYSKSGYDHFDEFFMSMALKMANVEIQITDSFSSDLPKIIAGGKEFSIDYQKEVNVEEEIQKLSEELKYNQGFLETVDRKLSNSKFVENAPAPVVEKERKKRADAEAKITMIQAQLDQLRN